MSSHIYRSWNYPLHSWVVISMSCVFTSLGPSLARSRSSSRSTPWSASLSWKMVPRLVMQCYINHFVLSLYSYLHIRAKMGLVTPQTSLFISFQCWVWPWKLSCDEIAVKRANNNLDFMENNIERNIFHCQLSTES